MKRVQSKSFVEGRSYKSKKSTVTDEINLERKKNLEKKVGELASTSIKEKLNGTYSAWGRPRKYVPLNEREHFNKNEYHPVFKSDTNLGQKCLVSRFKESLYYQDIIIQNERQLKPLETSSFSDSRLDFLLKLDKDWKFGYLGNICKTQSFKETVKTKIIPYLVKELRSEESPRYDSDYDIDNPTPPVYNYEKLTVLLMNIGSLGIRDYIGPLCMAEGGYMISKIFNNENADLKAMVFYYFSINPDKINELDKKICSEYCSQSGEEYDEDSSDYPSCESSTFFKFLKKIQAQDISA